MYYGAIYDYSNDYKTKLPNKVEACYFTFLKKYPSKKYLHIFINPYKDFTLEEFKKVLNTLKPILKFSLRKYIPSKDITLIYKSYTTKNSIKFLKETSYPLITLDINKVTLGEIKFIYHFLRLFHESDTHVATIKKCLKAKKELPREHIVNLATFFYANEKQSYQGHSFSLSWEEINKVSFKKFLKKYVTKDKYLIPEEGIETAKNKSFEEQLKIYKNL